MNITLFELFDDMILNTFDSPAGRLVTVCLWAVLVSSLLVNVYFVWSPVSSWVTSSDFMIRGGEDLGDPARDDDYTLQEEQLKELGTLELLRREMEDIGNQEMARDYQDRSDWSWFLRKKFKHLNL